MDFAWTTDQIALRERVVAFARGLNEGAVQRDQEGLFPGELWKQCADFGLQSMATPSAYNSSEVDTDLLSAALAMEAMGYGCRDNGLNFALAVQMWTVQHPLAAFGNEDQKQRYLPRMCSGDLIGAHAVTEPDAGSDQMAIKTTAAKVDGGYRMTGTKRYISLAPIADLALVLATVDADKGRWGITAFLVDTDSPGCTQGPVRDKMGLRTVPMGDFFFEDCFVPEANRLGPEGAGASISAAALGIERTFILAAQVGAMENQLERAVEHAQSRTQFGRPIGTFQSVSNRIADMKLALETARLLLYKVVWMIEQDQSVTLEAALLKLHLSEAFVATSLDAIRIHGGGGYVTENGIEHDLRDAVGGLLYGGTSDIQRVLVARMLGL